MRFANGVVCVTALAAATILSAADCDRSPGFYEREGHTVGSVRLKGPLRHFRFVREQTLRAGIPLRSRDVKPDGTVVESGAFQTVPWSLGTIAIQNRLRDPTLLQQFDLVLVTAGLENCDASAKSLDAVYNIFSFSIPASLDFERQSVATMVARSLIPSSLSRLFANTFAQPLLSYNAARGVYGGTSAHYQAPPGMLFDQASMLVTGSGNSLEGEAELSAARSRDRGALRDRDWGVNYRYSDVRSASEDSSAVRETTAGGRFGTFTKPLGALASGLRFGTAVHAGSGQTDARSPAVFRNAATTALKLYAGGALGAGPYAVRLSYGLQRTQPRSGVTGGFLKHVIDTRHSFRFLPSDHRPVSVELDAGAGWMPNNRALPLHEAFYGGNVVRSFITGDPWEIRADPLFRGLPQMSVRNAAGTSFGATRYATLNTTVAFTVWGKPLVPDEVLSDAGFTSALKGQLSTAESALAGTHITSDPKFPSMAQSVATLKPDLEPIKTRLQTIREALSGAAQAKADDALSSLDDVETEVDSAMDAGTESTSPTLAYRTLALGFGEDVPSLLNVLSDAFRALKPLASAEDAAWLESNAVRFEGLQKSVTTQLQAIEANALAKAHVELAFARKVVNSLLHEINVVSVSPLLMFDVARFGWERGTASSTRYAAGPGVRFSLVNVNVSVGYAFNVRRPARSPRGALVFGFSVSDLFR